MKKPLVEEKKTREQLKAKRDALLEEYSKTPMNSKLSIEIKSIDDQIAVLTELMVRERKPGSK
jgi:uncharacterized membrane protein